MATSSGVSSLFLLQYTDFGCTENFFLLQTSQFGFLHRSWFAQYLQPPLPGFVVNVCKHTQHSTSTSSLFDLNVCRAVDSLLEPQDCDNHGTLAQLLS